MRRRLERQGWTVWRGELVGILRSQDSAEIYPNIRRKYQGLLMLLEQHRPGVAEELQYLAAIHHGMPDFLCYRRGTFTFVECERGHEQLLPGQRRCIAQLQRLGFVVEVHKLVDPCTKTREALVDLATGTSETLDRQLRLTRALCGKA